MSMAMQLSTFQTFPGGYRKSKLNIKGKSFNQYIMAIFLNSKTTQTLHSVKEVLKADSCAVIAVFV